MKTADHINAYRQRFPGSPWDSDASFGMNGAFNIPIAHATFAECIISDGACDEAKAAGLDWEHVSVKIRASGKLRIPTWEEMCKIKDLFWKDDETVIQIHPAKKDYVNCNTYVLHVWRPVDGNLRLPPKICV